MHITGIISINLYNILISNLPNVTKLPTKWLRLESIKVIYNSKDYTSWEKKNTISSHKNVPQIPSSTGSVINQRAPQHLLKTQLLLFVVLWQLSPLLHRGHASHGCSRPVTVGSRDGNAEWLWFKDKPIDCMANEELSFCSSFFQSISFFTGIWWHHDLMALQVSPHFLPAFPLKAFPLIKCVYI